MELRRNQRHLLAAWNPNFRRDTVEAHLDRFLVAADRYRRKQVEEDDVYVWWAKFRSPTRRAPLPHINDILALDADCKPVDGEPHREVHLYITDYQSLYICHVGEISADDIRHHEDERDHIPEYYRSDDILIDCWFRLFDIRRLIASDPVAIIDELEKLHNVRHHDRPVSIYGGMIDLPLIVTRPDGARFFEEEERNLLTGGKFWAEAQAEQVGLGQMERELRENLFGDTAWRSLEPATRTFIATGEKIFRDNREDPTFDFTPVVVEFAKAFEVQCNHILRRGLGSAPRGSRMANVEGLTVDVAKHGGLALGQLARVIGEEQSINRELKIRLRYGDWLTVSLPPLLREIAEMRNAAAHSERVLQRDASQLRNRLVGVGCQAQFVELAEVWPAH